ncbi:MAG TPA: helix-turn-helix domain-containing protein [Solirubrobacteraceae bacterium]|nr:helix-turn-helix domain-containing protein [Solirubrobacteraceae bacterium]
MDDYPTRSSVDVPLLLPEEAARRLRVSVETLRKMIRLGLITAIKWPGNVRIDPAELHRFERHHATHPISLPERTTRRAGSETATQRLASERARKREPS